MVVKEVEEAVSKASVPAKAAVVGVFGALAGLPLIILVPVLLVTIGLGIYVVVTLIPFIVAGTVFILAFYVARWIKLTEPWNVLVPVGAALIAILPNFVSSLSQTAMSMAGAMVGGYSLTLVGFVAICLFLALLVSGAYVFIKQDSWSALGVSLTAVVMMITILPDMMGTSVGAGVVSLEGEAALAGIDPLLIILAIGIAIVWVAAAVAHRGHWFARR